MAHLKSHHFSNSLLTYCDSQTVHLMFSKLVFVLLSGNQVFRPRTSAEAMDLVGQLLEYTPSRRLSPLDACVHPFFDELRLPSQRLPNGRALPSLFNFSASGII